jgi:hypothetical protein
MRKVVPNAIDGARIGPSPMDKEAVPRAVSVAGVDLERAERGWREAEVGFLRMQPNRLRKTKIVRMVQDADAAHLPVYPAVEINPARTSLVTVSPGFSFTC